MFAKKPTPGSTPGKPHKKPSKATADRNRVGSSNRQRAKSQAAREIAPDYTGTTNPKRRAKALASLQFFAKTYFPDVCYLEFAPLHLRVIRQIELAATGGGLYALAMPRGFGKSGLCAFAVLWAALKGLHQFALIIGATEDAACELLAGIKMQLETNDLLLADFPEVCYPIRRLEGVAQRRLLWNGELIRMKFTAKAIEFPNLPPAKSSSACIGVAGLTGRIRGKKFTRPDGAEVRPSFVMLDDPQTDESALSASQCAARENLINGSVLGLAGPSKSLAAVMPCTVIRRGDLADRMLDRKTHPEWMGERAKMLESLPINEKLWDEYLVVRNRGMTEDGTIDSGNAFYAANRKELDLGAVASWPARFRPDELSAIQGAMNIKLYRPHAFAAECQQEPIDDAGDTERPTLAGLAARINRMARGTLPRWATRLTCFIDVQAAALFYTVLAFGDDFTAAIVAYGAFPDEGRQYYAYREMTRTLAATLAEAGKTGGEEAAIWHGLEILTDGLFGRTWTREDGTEFRIERAAIDSGYMAEMVYEFCRRSRHAAILYPSKGVGLRAGDTPMNEVKPKLGERRGFNTIITSDAARRVVRLLRYDTNFWKTFLARRLTTLARGSLTIFGDSEETHRMIADHFTAETSEKTEGRGRVVWEWRWIPGRDNHWLDGVVGCYALASSLGVRLEENRAAASTPAADRPSLADMQNTTRKGN